MHDVDLLIIGAGITGWIAAEEAARRDLSVAIVEPRSYPGYEISAYGHTFLPLPLNDDSLRRCPASIQPLFQLRSDDEIVAPEGLVRQHLLSAFERLGVPTLFEAEPVAVSTDDSACTGVLLACPPGLAWISCVGVIETRTTGAIMGSFSEGRRDAPSPRDTHIVHATFEMLLSDENPEDVIGASRTEAAAHIGRAESELELDPGSVHIHPSLRAEAVVVEYSFLDNTPDSDKALDRAPYRIATRLENETRRRSIDLASWLRDNAPGFEDATLHRLADECHAVPIPSGAVGRPGRVSATARGGGRRALTIDPPGDKAGRELSTLRTIPQLPWGFTLDDVGDAVDAATAAVEEAVANVPAVRERIDRRDDANPGRRRNLPARSGRLRGPGIDVPMDSLEFERLEDDALPVCLFLCISPEGLDPPGAADVDVCIAGVGTSGGMAMIACIESGVRVAAVETNRGLGGTHTVGGVVGYYDGYRDGASARVAQEAHSRRPSAIGGSSPGGLAHAEHLTALASKSQVELHTATRVCGVLRHRGGDDRTRVTGVLAANEAGLFAVRARVTIDATGDGDVAAHAGAGYRIGDDRDGMVQSFSMWGTELFAMPSFLLQRYLTDPGIYHPDVYSERLRAISIGHRENSIYHISPMVTPRESRRIVGEIELTMDDVLSGRTWPDVIAVARTRADSHAFTSSDLDRLGPIAGRTPLDVRIPYRCFIPKGVDALLVAGKAISGDRDATSFCRMNADVKNAGFALGLAAAQAVAESVSVRNIDMERLQQALRRVDVLPDWAFDPKSPTSVGWSGPREIILRLETDGFQAFREAVQLPSSLIRELLERRFAELAPSGEPVTVDLDPTLETSCAETQAADSAPYRSSLALVSMALAWHRSAHGGELLASLVKRAVEEQRHITMPHRRTKRTAVVRGGDGDDDYSLVNRLLVCAGRSTSAAVVAPLARLVGETPGPGLPFPLATPYDGGREDIPPEPYYHRLRAVAFAVERKADPSLAGPMDTLMARPGTTGYTVAVGDPRKPLFMLAHLEIRLARAAARCGSLLGARILVDYLNDTHSAFRRHARDELVAIVGTDLGTQDDWVRWLDRTPTLRPVPFDDR